MMIGDDSIKLIQAFAVEFIINFQKSKLNSAFHLPHILIIAITVNLANSKAITMVLVSRLIIKLKDIQAEKFFKLVD